MKSTRTHRQPGSVAVLLTGGAFALAACSGGSSSPQVASLATSPAAHASSESTSPPLPAGSPSQLLDEWTACMRSHGDPGQADPTIDADKVVHVPMASSIPGGLTGSTGPGGGPGAYCASYLNAAMNALRAGLPAIQLPSQAQFLKFAECMRANGVPDFPDPAPDGFPKFSGPPDDPAFQHAERVCTKQTAVVVPGAGQVPPGGVVQELPDGQQGEIQIPISGGNG